MVVVMPFGHAVPFGAPREVQATNASEYEKYVLTDVLPMVEAKYRVKTDKANRAIAGLSMGGGQALSMGFGHPELFSAVGAFSAAVPQQKQVEEKLPKMAKSKIPVIWFACGKDDSLFARSVELDELLTKGGIPHTWKPSPGAHTYTVWRKYLAEFTPLLFR